VNRVAVVTGGGSGIGRAICEHLARAGMSVAVLDVSGEQAAEATAAITAAGGKATAVTVDVSDRAAIDAAFASARADLGPVEVLVTSAALTGFVAFEDLTDEVWEREMSVNVNGVLYCMQAAIGDMVAGGWGRIVTISSVAGVTGSIRQAHYSASKGAVIALTKTIALEYATRGVTANTIPPFAVDTPGLRDAQADGELPAAKYLSRAIPIGRLGTVEDIAATCAFLCSEAAGYITGQVISVNGGAVT
jgi:2-hydroxycyclohexanecarboxyl-CoA dehydrogenase